MNQIEGKMAVMKLDSVTFRLKEHQDFHWLKKYGKAFWCVDATGSGCICIGMENGEKRYFCKIAGANTVEAEVTPEESVAILKNAVSLYRELEHPNLIKLVEAYGYDRFYIAVFEWANGECLFDHWNFEQYKADHLLQSPKERFKALPVTKRLLAAVNYKKGETVSDLLEITGVPAIREKCPHFSEWLDTLQKLPEL